jgi:hypothetical protein
MKRVKFIWSGGKEILFLDFYGCTVKELLEAIEEAEQIIRTHPENSLLILTDVTNARFDEQVRVRIKEFTKHNTPYVKASAVVGVIGLKKIILEAIMLLTGRRFQTCGNVEQAKSWLAAHV